MKLQIPAALLLVGSLLLGAGRAEPVRAQEIPAGHFTLQSGEDLYKGICQGCHMPDAKGAVGAGSYPALAQDARLMVAIYPITVVIRGQRAMPSFGDSLDDGQIANVVNYIRTHFGNHYTGAVSPATVKANRPALHQTAEPPR
jgi:mono/diheme cytochrome c family protein